MSTPVHYETVIISDVHLGTPDCRASEAADFLASITCNLLILNGDIIDQWYLSRGGSWKDSHTQFLHRVLEKMEKQDVPVIYIRGNHDNVLDRLLPLRLPNLTFMERYFHETPQGRYLVIHGDGFDLLSTNSKALTVFGAVFYEVLVRVSRINNKWRRWRKKPHFSLGAWLKEKLKHSTSFLGNYEAQVEKLARAVSCDGIICGHIHYPVDKDLDGIHYLNSGDWVESMTAVVETQSGEFQILTYDAFKNSLEDASSEAFPTAKDEGGKPGSTLAPIR